MTGDEGRGNRAHVREVPAQHGQRLLSLWEQQAGYVASPDFPTFQRKVRDEGHGFRPEAQGDETGAGKERRLPQESKQRAGG